MLQYSGTCLEWPPLCEDRLKILQVYTLFTCLKQPPIGLTLTVIDRFHCIDLIIYLSYTYMQNCPLTKQCNCIPLTRHMLNAG